jgi:hypothetical protein
MREKLWTYLKSTFSEKDGTGSSTRLLAGGGVLATIVWVSYIVILTGHLPDLGGAAMFVSASFSGYGINKITGMGHRDDQPKNPLDK